MTVHACACALATIQMKSNGRHAFRFLAGGITFFSWFYKTSWIIVMILSFVLEGKKKKIKTGHKLKIQTYLNPNIYSSKAKTKEGTSKVNNNNISLLEVCNKAQSKARYKTNPHGKFIVLYSRCRQSVTFAILIYLSISYIYHHNHWKTRKNISLLAFSNN